MSKISYSSLEEVWGNSFNNNVNNNVNTNNNNDVNNNLNKVISNNSNNNSLDISQLEENKKLLENNKRQNEQTQKVLKDMNNIERNKLPENNINDDYNKYRFNPLNQVNSLYESKNDYSPFKDDIDKKYLQDKIIQIENDFRKYKTMINSNDVIESFDNNNSNNNDSNNNEILDLIVLIIIGLIIIFVMDSVFKIGKAIGARAIS